MRLKVLIMTVMLSALAPHTATQAQRFGGDQWQELCRQTVDFGIDNDTIKISDNEDFHGNRAFRKLRFVAGGNDVWMIAIGLVFLNGYREDVCVDRMIDRDGEFIVDLPGERSFLRQIDMKYSANPRISFSIGGIWSASHFG